MTELIIGADGFVGSHLLAMTNGVGTTRGYAVHQHYDLLNPTPLPHCDIGYICAAINGFQPCEGNVLAYRTNVDGTIKTARDLIKSGAFPVWISSCSVEWADTAYSRQKAMVEAVFLSIGGIGVVRAGRVSHENVKSLCETLIKVGRKKIEGITLWNVIDSPYQGQK